MHRWLGAALVRPLVVAALVLVPALPVAARAQEVECDKRTDKEVRALHFEGNRAFSTDELSRLVHTTPSSFAKRYFRIFGAKRCYPDIGLKTDIDNLTTFYKNNGFYRTMVDTIVKPRSPTAVEVTFRINEGEPLRIDTLKISGLDSVAHPEAIVKDLQMKTGGRFGLLLLFTDIDTMVSRLRNVGYPKATVFRSWRTHPAELRAEVELEISTGPRTRFGSINIERLGVLGGPAEIDSAVVLRLLAFSGGDWYSDHALAESQRSLYNVGAYRHVGISIDTTAQRGDSIADVRVNLREDYIHEVNHEEAWATLDCFRVNGQYTDKNFLDGAHHLELATRVSKLGYGAPTSSRLTRNLCYRSYLDEDSLASSKLNYFVGTTIREPTLFGTHWVPSYSLYTERRGEYKAYLRSTEVGSQLTLTRNIGLGMPLRLGYTFEVGQTRAEPAILCAQFTRCDQRSQADVQKRLRLAVASASLQRIRTDNPIEPSAGYSIGGEIRGSASAFGSDATLQFFKGTFDASWYQRLTPRTVLATRLRGGFVVGGTEISGAPKLPPPQERLYAGGATSVRGFGQNELGPLIYQIARDNLDSSPLPDSAFAFRTRPGTRALRTIPLGGNSLFEFNAELRIRDPFFPELLEYVPFIDGGEVQQVGSHSLNPGKLFYTPGLGIRLFSPVGPIQLNAGYNHYGGRAGTAYFFSPIGVTTRAPLICVTAPGEDLVPVRVGEGGALNQNLSDCPHSFSPAQRSGFLQHLTLTLSIGTTF